MGIRVTLPSHSTLTRREAQVLDQIRSGMRALDPQAGITHSYQGFARGRAAFGRARAGYLRQLALTPCATYADMYEHENRAGVWIRARDRATGRTSRPPTARTGATCTRS